MNPTTPQDRPTQSKAMKTTQSVTPEQLHEITIVAYEAAVGPGFRKNYDDLTDGSKAALVALAAKFNGDLDTALARVAELEAGVKTHQMEIIGVSFGGTAYMRSQKKLWALLDS